MASMTKDALADQLRRAVGDEVTFERDAEWLMPLRELGFDSLAIIDVTNKIEQTYGVELPSVDDLFDITPDEFLRFVNGQPPH